MNRFKFTCPQWQNYGGSFNESMYHIDHIKELCNGGTNKLDNLQALCPQCHASKTNYMKRIKSDIKKEKRNVPALLKKQVAARQLFKCANVSPLYLYKPQMIGGVYGALVGSSILFGNYLYKEYKLS